MSLARRDFLARTALGLAGAVLARPARALATHDALVDDDPAATRFSPTGALKLGVASYSLRNFTRDKAISMVVALHTPWINLKSVHLPYDLSPTDIAAARHEVESAGLQIVGGGTITFENDTDDDVRKYFDYAKAAGMPLIVATAHPDILRRVERFAKSYDIKVAIHNHGPEDKVFPSPYEVLEVVKPMDRRMGLCIDIGHTARTGVDIVKAVADAGPRLLDMHAKDLRDRASIDSQCIVGEGVLPFPEIFRQLVAMRYAGYVNLEYEIEPDDPLPGMKQSLAYMRGVSAALATPAFHGRAARG
jgi:sugar phosphate isomerase/epimerase